MKMLKRVSVVFLVLAILASCIAFAVTAANKEYTIDNYETILEYYEEPDIFDYDFEDMTSGQIADRLGMTESNVRVQLFRAMRKMQDMLTD